MKSESGRPGPTVLQRKDFLSLIDQSTCLDIEHLFPPRMTVLNICTQKSARVLARPNVILQYSSLHTLPLLHNLAHSSPSFTSSRMARLTQSMTFNLISGGERSLILRRSHNAVKAAYPFEIQDSNLFCIKVRKKSFEYNNYVHNITWIQSGRYELRHLDDADADLCLLRCTLRRSQPAPELTAR